MKYTVIIRQPVPDEVRHQLEGQLVQRFGLNEQQAERLAARRAGRLMKPTSQARAELLLQVYESVGAQVSLEEVREESDSPAAAFGAGALTPEKSDDVVMAAPLPGEAARSTQDVFSGAVFTPSSDLFGAAPTLVGDLFGGAPVSPAGAAASAEPLPAWATGGAAPATTSTKAAAPLTGLEAQLASELDALAAKPAEPKVADDWADFAGGLNLPETAPVSSSAPRQTTEFLTAVTEDAPVQTRPRTSLVQQIRLGTLLPLGLSGLLTLGLLGLALPKLQNQLVQDNAATLASTLALSTGGEAQSQALNSQLDDVVRASDVQLVQIEWPSGQSVLRTTQSAQSSAYAKTLGEWAKTHPRGGQLKLGNQNYMVNRVSVVKLADGQTITTEPGNEKNGTLLRRVTVGVLNTQSGQILRNSLLLVLLSTLIGLGIAALLASQAAQRIVQPLSELVKVAEAISLGDLTRPVKVERNDEIGDLAQGLERMRLSLEAAMDRLRRRKRG